MSKYNAIEYPIHQIRRWIEEDGKTQQWIAGELSTTLDPRVTAKLIYKVCKKHQIQCQRTGPRSGEGHPEWKGGRLTNKDGYVQIYSPDHPTTHKNKKYVLEHRLVMEKHLGRYLTKEEVVHHRNGVKDDNRIDNLELFATNGKHLAETLKGQCPKWTQDGIRRMKAGAQRKRLAALERQEQLRQLSEGILEMIEPDVCLSSEILRRWLAERNIAVEQAYEMGPEQLIQLLGL